MRVFLLGAVILGLLASLLYVYKVGGENARLKIKADRQGSTIERLEKDSEKLKVLTTQNRELSRSIKHAETIYAQVKDPTGCFRTSIPVVAAVELRDLYDSLSGEKGSSFIRKIRSYLPH